MSQTVYYVQKNDTDATHGLTIGKTLSFGQSPRTTSPTSTSSSRRLSMGKQNGQKAKAVKSTAVEYEIHLVFNGPPLIVHICEKCRALNRDPPPPHNEDEYQTLALKLSHLSLDFQHPT